MTTLLTDIPATRRLLEKILPPLEGEAAATLVLASAGRAELRLLCLVDDIPPNASSDEARQCVSLFAEASAATARHDPGLLVVLQRRGSPDLRETDTQWVPAAVAGCAEHGVELLGVWLVAGRARPRRLDAPLAQPARV